MIFTSKAALQKTIIAQLNSFKVLFLSDSVSVVKSIILLNMNCLLNPNNEDIALASHYISEESNRLTCWCNRLEATQLSVLQKFTFHISRSKQRPCCLCITGCDTPAVTNKSTLCECSLLSVGECEHHPQACFCPHLLTMSEDLTQRGECIAFVIIANVMSEWLQWSRGYR